MERRGGFSVLEVGIATVILTVAILGLAASTGRMLSPANDAEASFVAVQAVENRLAEIRLDPRYAQLAELYGGVEEDVPGLPGATRSTWLERTRDGGSADTASDYWTVVVSVAGGDLLSPIRRTLVIAAP